jgi:putative inorganic carbon (HCO3(-)) transporter
MMIPFVIAALYTIKQPRKLHIGIFGLLLLLFVCLMLTISRGGWFSFISSLLFMSIWLKALGAVIIILVISIIFTREMYYDYLKERLNSFFSFLDGSSIDRNRIWEAAWKMFLARPLLGLGLGTFMFNFPFFISAGYKYTTPYAHNCYLQMAAETGVFGLLSFMTLVAVFLTFGIDALNTSRRDFSWYILLASLAAAIGYLVQMTVDTIFYSLDLGILFWLVLGIGISAMRLCEHSTPAQKTSS